MANSNNKKKPAAFVKKNKHNRKTRSAAGKTKTVAKADTKKKSVNENDTGIPMANEIELPGSGDHQGHVNRLSRKGKSQTNMYIK